MAKGTGLGLSIRCGIVGRLVGRMMAGKHVEGGAEFVLELPWADAESTTSPAPTSPHTPQEFP